MFNNVPETEEPAPSTVPTLPRTEKVPLQQLVSDPRIVHVNSKSLVVVFLRSAIAVKVPFTEVCRAASAENVPAQHVVSELVLLKIFKRVPDMVAPLPRIAPGSPSTVNVPSTSEAISANAVKVPPQHVVSELVFCKIFKIVPARVADLPNMAPASPSVVKVLAQQLEIEPKIVHVN